MEQNSNSKQIDFKNLLLGKCPIEDCGKDLQLIKQGSIVGDVYECSECHFIVTDAMINEAKITIKN